MEESKDERRALMFAAKFRADHAWMGVLPEPTDKVLAATFAGCVRPVKSALYPRIRELLAEGASRSSMVEVLARDVQAGDHFEGCQPVTSVSTERSGHSDVTTIEWTDLRWIDDNGRQAETFVGTRGQCWRADATVRVWRTGGSD